MKADSKRGYEFSFAWLFAIIIGAMVIFLAIYVATQIVGTKVFERETIEAKEIGVLLTPVETNIEEGIFATLFVPDETRIINTCDEETRNHFGSQGISIALRSDIGKEWDDFPGVEREYMVVVSWLRIDG